MLANKDPHCLSLNVLMTSVPISGGYIMFLYIDVKIEEIYWPLSGAAQPQTGAPAPGTF